MFLSPVSSGLGLMERHERSRSRHSRHEGDLELQGDLERFGGGEIPMEMLGIDLYSWVRETMLEDIFDDIFDDL